MQLSALFSLILILWSNTDACANHPLRAWASGSTLPHETGHYRVAVTADYTERADLSPQMTQEIERYYRVLRSDPPRFSRMYRYEFIIENPNPGILQVNFSNWEFSHSPFVEAAQAFQIEIPAEHRYEISFWSTVAPSEVQSPINVGYRHRDITRFSYAGSGTAMLYKPLHWGPSVLEPVRTRPMTAGEIQAARRE